MEAAKASLQQANATHDEALIAQAKAHFAIAKAQFMVAGQIADSSQLLGRLEGLPAVGDLARSRHTAVDGIATMGAAISDAGQELADLYGQLIKPTTTGGQEGRTLLTVLDQTDSSLVKVRTDLDRAQKAAAQVDVQVLPAGQQATFVKARNTISSALAGLDEFERLVPVLTEALGGNWCPHLPHQPRSAGHRGRCWRRSSSCASGCVRSRGTGHGMGIGSHIACCVVSGESEASSAVVA